MTGSSDAVKVLEAARALLTRTGWTRGALAKDADGVSCPPESEKAVCFCALGAIEHAAFEITQKPFSTPFWEARRIFGDVVFRTTQEVAMAFNDRPQTSVVEICRLFDVAIQAAAEIFG